MSYLNSDGTARSYAIEEDDHERCAKEHAEPSVWSALRPIPPHTQAAMALGSIN